MKYKIGTRQIMAKGVRIPSTESQSIVLYTADPLIMVMSKFKRKYKTQRAIIKETYLLMNGCMLII